MSLENPVTRQKTHINGGGFGGEFVYLFLSAIVKGLKAYKHWWALQDLTTTKTTRK